MQIRQGTQDLREEANRRAMPDHQEETNHQWMPDRRREATHPRMMTLRQEVIPRRRIPRRSNSNQNSQGSSRIYQRTTIGSPPYQFFIHFVFDDCDGKMRLVAVWS